MKTQVLDLSSSDRMRWEFLAEDDSAEWTRIDVPAGGWKRQGHACHAGIYRTSFSLPDYVPGSVVRIHFEAVNFGACVCAGVDPDQLIEVGSHIGGWMPFDVDVSAVARPGERLHLRVDVAGREKFKREGKYTVPEAAPWQKDIADGILRGVELEILPPVYIDEAFIRTSVDDDTIQPEVVVVNRSANDVVARLSCRISTATPGRDFDYPNIQAIEVTVLAGETRSVAFNATSWGLGPESYWWPNVPYRSGYRANLHEANVDVEVGGVRVHALSTRFGFREFKARGSAYFLNDIRCNLRGDNQQEANFGTDAYGVFPGFGPPSATNAGWPGAVDNLLRVNFNVLRIHQVPCTSYMLDVCDELGLMIIDETPVRGSEGLEDFVTGRPNMIRAAEELARRDRNHPSVVIWSAANEIWVERGLALALQGAIRAIDDTRPIIIDGVPDLGPEIINMEHYRGGLGVLPEMGGTPRSDRPYGETEAVWPADNSLRGFAWMSTATRIRRIKQNADIRNYVLNNCWSNYVPGQGPEFQVLERKVKEIRWDWVVEKSMEIMPPLEDPWSNPQILLMRQSFHPTPVWDTEFDDWNKHSDEFGQWPSVVPELRAGERVSRKLVVFNDTFGGVETLTLLWELRAGDAAGELLDHGRSSLRVPMGEFRRRTVQFEVPRTENRLAFIVRLYGDGGLIFEEDKMRFRVVERAPEIA